MVIALKPAINFRRIPPVGLQCTIDLSKLFPDQNDRSDFKTRLKAFCESQQQICKIIRDTENNLSYQSEQMIPSKRDNRPPALFVFGDPATHSINNGMFFSSEGKNGGEHRFWKFILPGAGIRGLDHPKLPEKKRNSIRLKALLNLEYKAPVRIGLCVFISFPSAASGNYSGIQGVKRLFGSKAMAELVKDEKDRVLSLIKEFVVPDGAVFTFQSDAWNGLRSDRESSYNLSKASDGQLRGAVDGMPEIQLFGLPPTRLSGPTGKVLKQFISEIGL